MRQGMTGVNGSEETIKLGPLGIRFLLTGDMIPTEASRCSRSSSGWAEAGGAGPQERCLRGGPLPGIEGSPLHWTVDGTPIEIEYRAGAVHSARRGAPLDNFGSEDVKQPSLRSSVFRGSRRSNRRRCRRPSRRRENDGGLPPSWHDGRQAARWVEQRIRSGRRAAAEGARAEALARKSAVPERDSGSTKRTHPALQRCGYLLPSRGAGLWDIKSRRPRDMLAKTHGQTGSPV